MIFGSRGGFSGDLINGVAHFVQDTEPTQRNDGSALQDGDRWYDPSTQKSWVRKGAYWLSETLYTTSYPRLFTSFPSSISFTTMFPSESFTRPLLSDSLVFVDTIYLNCTISASTTDGFVIDGSNYFDAYWRVGSVNFPSERIDNINKFIGTNNGEDWSYSFSPKSVINISHVGYRFQRILNNPVGSPSVSSASAFSVVQNLSYRLVYQ